MTIPHPTDEYMIVYFLAYYFLSLLHLVVVPCHNHPANVHDQLRQEEVIRKAEKYILTASSLLLFIGHLIKEYP